MFKKRNSNLKNVPDENILMLSNHEQSTAQ